MIYAGASLDGLGVVVLGEIAPGRQDARTCVGRGDVHLPAHVSDHRLVGDRGRAARRFGAWIREVLVPARSLSQVAPGALPAHDRRGGHLRPGTRRPAESASSTELVAATGDSGMRGGRGSRSWNRSCVRRVPSAYAALAEDRHLLPAITFRFSPRLRGCRAPSAAHAYHVDDCPLGKAAEIRRYVGGVSPDAPGCRRARW